MEISFHGAAGDVTGSCYLLEACGKRILLDCGLFQGGGQSDEANRTPFPFEPRSLDYLLLTHAHLDHCGRIPLLAQHGFRGEIVSTSATRDLARLVLLDAAGLQVEEARRLARHHQRRGERATGPLYDVPDVLDALDCFGRRATYGQPIEICPGIQATFGDAGHILGSAWILLEVEEQQTARRIVFSGDIGNAGRPVLPPPMAAPAADDVVMESTYGDRAHKPADASVAELRQAIQDTLARGGNVVIPTFALERAQDILYCLREMIENGDLPRHLPVYLDSPMAISATDIYRKHAESLAAGPRALLESGQDPFSLPGFHCVRDTAESMALNQIEGGAVIMAGSGMATGGRVLHHLKHNLWKEKSSVVFVGYAATGTLARRIIEGQPVVNVMGEEIHVAAHIYTIGGFSAHADQQELVAWHRGSGQPACTFLTHGEDGPRGVLARLLESEGFHVELPVMNEKRQL